MTKHEFGGHWTTDKLERVRKYLSAYTKILTRNPKAREFFTTIYVDAFAGSGHRVERAKEQAHHAELLETAPGEPDEDAEAFKKGSARIALEVEPAFDRYVFIERDAKHVAELEGLKAEFPQKAIDIHQHEANEFVQAWCQKTDWRKHRAVVFLDPYGMQVEWATVEAIARTKAIDLWWLFPLGVAVNRLLPRTGSPTQAWAEALTRTFGTDDWKTCFYQTEEDPTLFGVESTERKDADLDRIGAYTCDRLKSIFAEVADNPLPLLNSVHMPIYLLCFAAGNPKGARTAVKIAQHVLKPRGRARGDKLKD